MQPSELWRRGIVLPHSIEVAQRIRDWDVDSTLEVDYLTISNEPLFSKLWDIGFFTKINASCGTLMGDYESEWLLPKYFPAATMVIEQLLIKHPSGDVGDFLRKLAILFRRATEDQMPLYFEI